jgi:hypothetical protein
VLLTHTEAQPARQIAGAAWPGIIANRANLLKLGANAYRDLKDGLKPGSRTWSRASGPARRIGTRRCRRPGRPDQGAIWYT